MVGGYVEPAAGLRMAVTDAFTKIRWTDTVTYGDVHLQGEVEQCTYNFEASNPDLLFTLFGLYEQEPARSN